MGFRVMGGMGGIGGMGFGGLGSRRHYWDDCDCSCMGSNYLYWISLNNYNI